MRVSARLSLLILAATAACDDRRDAPTMPVEIGPDALSAYVVVSNPNAPVGTEVTVSVRSLRGRNVAPIGSFTIRLAYDSSGLTFGQAAANAQGMVLANAAQRGLVVAAGASAEGFTNDELLTATFRVTAAGGLRSLVLTVNELNSLKFEDQRANLQVMKGVYRAPAPAK
jgi:hypothetical protein